MELKSAIIAMNSFESFAKKTKECPEITVDDLMLLSKIDSTLADSLNTIRKWFAGELVREVILPDRTPTPAPTVQDPVVVSSPAPASSKSPWLDVEPYSEWRYVGDKDVYVSEKGTIYSLKQRKVLETAFIDGDLRVYCGADGLPKRAATIVAKAFAIRSANRNGDYIIAFMDGDRRNLAASNIYWVAGDSRSANQTLYLIEDICRRIVEHDGNVDAILERYKYSKPAVTRNAICSIIKKELHANVSNKFFTVKDNKIIPYGTSDGADEKTSSPKFFDVGGFFLTTNDRKTSIALLKDKIKDGAELTAVEKTIIVFVTMDIIGGKRIPDVQKIAKVAKEQFGITLPFEMIDTIRNDYNSEIAKMFGR